MPTKVDPAPEVAGHANHGFEGRVRYDWNPCVLSAQPRSEWFDPAYWHARGEITGEASGRGQAIFIDAGAGRCWVLRHYRRGGVFARWTRDRYLWLGQERSRATRELALLCWLHARGLSVPRPVAARTVRDRATYRADLLTEAIPQSRPLAERLMQHAIDAAIWSRCGECVARMHRLGIWHADLNARNLLLDSDDDIFVIDFDRARHRRPASRWRLANLARLRRSLDKFAANTAAFHFTEKDWQTLRAGYDRAFRTALARCPVPPTTGLADKRTGRDIGPTRR